MKKKSILILLILLGIIFFICYIFLNNKVIYFTLNGNNNLELNIGEEYTELGYKAHYCSRYVKLFCEDISQHVKITKREVEENKYFLNYILDYKTNEKILTRKISFVDKESPIIKIDDNIETICSNAISNFGYKAFDNVDGDITEKVIKTIKNNKIYYSVVDSSGNKKVVFRDLNYVDDQAPEIILNGSNVNYVFLNQDYVDKGVTVTDNCDEKINDKIKTINNVNTSEVGEYDVIYSVADEANNISTVTRKVIVYNDISTVPKNGKKVYLTFDDGPCSYTSEILDILDKYNVKATFFVTNQFSNYHNLIKREFDSGHTVAVHTFSHNYKKIYSSFDNYFTDFNNINQIIYEQTGTYAKIYRFPGGSSNTISKFNKGIMTEIVEKMNTLGYHYFDWNVDSMDTSVDDPEKIFMNVKKGIDEEAFSVVLMHDIKKANIKSVEKIIQYGLENGYTFLPLDENSPVVHHSINN